MSNIELNAGGVIGALVGGGVVAAVVFSLVETTEGGRGPYKLIIVGLIGGAFAGNFLWGQVFKKPDDQPSDED